VLQYERVLSEDGLYRVFWSGRFAGFVRREGNRRRPSGWSVFAPPPTIGGLGTLAGNRADRHGAAQLLVVLAFGITIPDMSPHSVPGSRVRRGSPAATGRSRAFGVEIELTGPNGTEVMRALQAHNVRVVFIGTYRSTSGARGVWELKHDSSVSGEGLELVSPRLRGAEGFSQLRAVCTALAEVGATVDRSCGLHVHHDLRGLSADQIRRQVLHVLERQDMFYSMVAPSRRQNGYCGRWRSEHVLALRAFEGPLRSLAFIGPRGGLNLTSYARHGTVEFRAHGGTTSFAKIAAWVRFGQAALAAGESTFGIGDGDLYSWLRGLTAYGLLDEDIAVLRRFESAAARAEQNVEASDYHQDELNLSERSTE